MKNILAIIILSVFISSCGDVPSTEQRPSPKYEEKKASLEETERSSPLRFLKVSGSSHGNLVNQTVIEGEILNKATIVSYKNIELRITFHDKEGAVIEKQKEILDDVVKPGSSMDFKVKTSHVKGTESVTFDITGAVADK